ncbi:hypothetical protein ACVWZK_000107 [Bradyrhizobium sp. GM0.4]
MVVATITTQVKHRVKLLRAHLRGDAGGEDRRKDRRSSQIAEIHRHRHGVAAGLAERRREYLDDPKSQGDFWNLARWLSVDRAFVVLIHASSTSAGYRRRALGAAVGHVGYLSKMQRGRASGFPD